MKDKIQEIADYFKAKIINGEYDVVELTGSIMSVKIDNEYPFLLWVYMEGLNFRVFSYTDLDIISQAIEFTDDEKKKAYSHVKTYIKNNRANVKAQKIQALKTELKELES